MKIHSGPVTSVAFSPDGQILASASEDRTIRLFRLENGVLSTSAPPELDISPLRGLGEGFGAVSFSSDSRHVVGGEHRYLQGGVVDVFELETGDMIAEHKVSYSPVTSLSSHPTQGIFACGAGEDNYFGGLSLVDTEENSVTPVLEDVFGGIEGVAMSPDGTLIAGVGRYDTVRLFSFPGGEEVAALEAGSYHPFSVAFSPDGRFLASVGDDEIDAINLYRGIIHIWDIESGELVQYVEISRLPLRTVAFSPNGEVIIAAGDDLLIHAVGAHSYTLLDTMRGHVGPINSVAFSPDGAILVSGSDDNYIRWWTVGDLKDEWQPDGGIDTESTGDSETDSRDTVDSNSETVTEENDGGADTHTGEDTSSDSDSITDSVVDDTESEDDSDAGDVDGGSTDSQDIIDTESETDTSTTTVNDTDILISDGGIDGGLDASTS